MTINNNDVEIRGIELQLDMVRDGVEAKMPAGATLIVSGVSYTKADLLKLIDTYRDDYKKVREGRLSLRQLVQRRTDRQDETVRFLGDMRVSAQALLGRDNPELVKFGFKAGKRKTAPTVEEKLARKEKAKATREARHTMGPRQREAIKGSVPPAIPAPPAPAPGATTRTG